MLPGNMPLWHKDHFKLKAIEKKQIQELSSLPQAGHTFVMVFPLPSLLRTKVNHRRQH